MRILFLFLPLSLFLFLVPAESNGGFADYELPNLDLEELSIDPDGVLTGYVINPTEETLTKVVLKFKGRDPASGVLKLTKTVKVAILKPKERKKIKATLGPEAHLLEYEIESEYEFPAPEVTDFVDTATEAGIEKTDTGYIISGEGPALTDIFSLTSGTTTFRFRFEEDNDFAVHLLNEAGETVETLLERKGPYRGYVKRELESANYTLDVAAEGAWSVTIVEKAGSAASAPSGPLEMETSDDGVITITN